MQQLVVLPSDLADAKVTKLDIPGLGLLEFYGGVPKLSTFDAHKDCKLTKVFKGGEKEALKILEQNIKKKEWIASFKKPMTNPTSLTPDTTALSPYLKFGCLSSRLMFWKIQEVYTACRGNHSKPPESLHGQLLFREWFYLCAYKTPYFDKMVKNENCKQIEWGTNPEYLKAWENG